MQLSFAAWSSYSNLKFVQVDDPSADIVVSFGSGYHGDESVEQFKINFKSLVICLHFQLSF